MKGGPKCQNTRETAASSHLPATTSDVRTSPSEAIIRTPSQEEACLGRKQNKGLAKPLVQRAGLQGRRMVCSIVLEKDVAENAALSCTGPDPGSVTRGSALFPLHRPASTRRRLQGLP